MNIFNKVKTLLHRSWLPTTTGFGVSAASQLPPVSQPKVPARSVAVPSHLRSAKAGNSKLPEKDLRLASTDITSLRTRTTTKEIIKELTVAFPDLSASVDAYLRTAITGSFTVVAKNIDGTFNYEATDAAQQLITRFDVLKNYATGFNGMYSIRSISESLAKELRLYGSCAMELVLGKGRVPERLAPVSTTKIKFYQDGLDFKPVQVLGGEEIDLDYPTFFYVALDQDLTEPYSASPMESAVQPVLFGQEFFNDVRRVIRRAIHPKLVVTLDEETVRRSVPADYFGQPEKVREYIDTVVSSVTTQINGLNPEDALVVLSSVEAEYLNNGNQSLDAEYDALTGLIDAKVATGTKTLPSVLGHGSGSANIASAEALLFMKNAEGAVQQKLNEIFSQAMTLAVRLLGHDVSVEFRYKPIDLRPDTELEAFYTMRQSRVLELLSLGLLTDEEASIQLTGKLPPKGYKALAGTGFRPNTSDEPAKNPYSGTSTGPGGGTTNQNLKPDTPQQGKSQNKGKTK